MPSYSWESFLALCRDESRPLPNHLCVLMFEADLPLAIYVPQAFIREIESLLLNSN